MTFLASLTRGCTSVAVMAAVACANPPAIERLAEARRVTSELLVQFTKAVDATNRVVMANDETAAEGFVRQSEQASAAVQQNAEILTGLFASLHYAEETQRLDEFVRRFAGYQALDRRIVGLALENTNVKARRLSFGPAQEAASAFNTALHAAPRDDGWQARALTATAVSAVREIQVLQAQHIPEEDDAIMTGFERQIAAAEGVARESLRDLALLRPPTPPALLTAAGVALDRFMSLNAEIVRLSKQNSNVRSLALSLGEQGTLAARCEDDLRELQAALAQRGFSGTR